MAARGSGTGGLTGASLALLGGLAYSAQGVTSLAVGATVLAALPALWLVVVRNPPEALEPAA